MIYHGSKVSCCYNTSVAHANIYYLYDLSLLNKHIPPITLHSDTQVTIYINLISRNLLKIHRRVRHKFIRKLSLMY